MTMIYDLARARLLWRGKCRDKAALRAFLEEWGQKRRLVIRAV
ncbi:MAG: hypothetical protein QME88_04155 [Actinomycetota bacterium]|nr:hypothetical protein [Actinomycetota bacterium]